MKDKNRVTMERMHRNAVRLLGLINQLLDLSKLDAGNMKLEFIESDLFRTLRILASSFQTLADKKKIEFALKTCDSAHIELGADLRPYRYAVRARKTTPCGVYSASMSDRPARIAHRLNVPRVAGLS